MEGPEGYDEISGDPSVEFTLRVGSSNAVPEPATMLLLGSGLIGGAFVRRRRHA